MQINTEKCFLKVGNETKRAYRIDFFNDYKRALYDIEKKCYVTEDWEIVPRSDYYGDNLVSPQYLQTFINFDDNWDSELPVYQAEYPVFRLIQQW